MFCMEHFSISSWTLLLATVFLAWFLWDHFQNRNKNQVSTPHVIPKFSGSLKSCSYYSKIQTKASHREMTPKDADNVVNNEDHDQTATTGVGCSGLLGLQCLPETLCSLR